MLDHNVLSNASGNVIFTCSQSKMEAAEEFLPESLMLALDIFHTLLWRSLLTLN